MADAPSKTDTTRAEEHARLMQAARKAIERSREPLRETDTTASIIKIADHAERLTRLRLYQEQAGREIDLGELERSYTTACCTVFGHTPDAFDSDDVPVEPWSWYVETCKSGDQAAAESFANQRGYSLRHRTGVMLHDWQSFLLLIIAQSYDLFASTPEQLAAIRLKHDAQACRESKQNGAISGLRST